MTRPGSGGVGSASRAATVAGDVPPTGGPTTGARKGAGAAPGAATPPGGPLHLDALGPGGPFRSRERLTINDVAGTPIAELSLVPRLFVHRAMAALRRAETMPADERLAALARAGEAFEHGAPAGITTEEYTHLVSRMSGMPISVVRSAVRGIARSLAGAGPDARCARPAAAVESWSDPATRQGSAVWTRRADVFAVHAAGNHPGVHSLWPEALAYGYRVAVRPSRREPLTPYRLVTALRDAGFGADQVVLLPTDHAVADDILREADLSMVYGGDEVVRKYGQVGTVLPQGPGRSKILISGEDWRAHLDMIVDSVADEGGTACVNATAVYVEGDPTPLAEALAERLAAIPSLPPQDPGAVLPTQPVDAARAVERYLLDHAGDATAWLGGDGVVDPLPGGGAVLRPAVFQVGRADAPQTGIELGFPCVWVAPWSAADGVGPLRDTLVLTAITQDDLLVNRLVEDPSISNVYLGDHPTYWMRPDIPHDGYLGEFLMRTKAVIRD
ncbi:aldehyde dehydrogenase family protein [Frankia sp. CNm7]|uniref:Aldehyde dehydrogenase family protein n=1 Tax=Frankia nepalensis TaxID=1836974 RepID=A0A937UN94_9ACTN|nr:aldehyde dehydrogenase family protein [Frankia nepalensis]MBL7495438.1 aldehyde dehydrogenase family protein [Frankia nepalensis]MBL7510732.1 aldehyde dehydrogenase family protein [Frankia nepalensis]MBL7522677.1 aldehyde dehydrogenase family protein [Frankia nepalensis]MBL7625995.1 aldehyde dehydrogenase family protein [Frankia nepalensis]